MITAGRSSVTGTGPEASGDRPPDGSAGAARALSSSAPQPTELDDLADAGGPASDRPPAARSACVDGRPPPMPCTR